MFNKTFTSSSSATTSSFTLGYFSNSAGVIIFTLLSVHWAERIIIMDINNS